MNRITQPTFVLAAGIVLGATCSLASAQFVLQPAQSIAAGSQPEGAAIVDVNGDGNADLVTTADGPERIVTQLGDGLGGYSAGPISLIPSSSSVQDLIAADFDGDGDMDIALAVRDPQGSVLVRVNNGLGSFAAGSTTTVGDRPRGLSAGDMDGDGDIDLAVANRDDSSVSVLTNTGAGAFSTSTIVVGGETRTTALLDFDADGDMDLAVTDHDNRSVNIYTNTGGVMAMPIVLGVGPFVRPDGLAAADLDNDGRPDLIAATSDQTMGINQITVYMNTGGAFSAPVSYPTGGSNTSDVLAADFDCDGLMDAATVNNDSNDASFLRNTGGGVFGAAQVMSLGTDPGRPTAGDADGDGDADFAVTNRTTNDFSLIINDTCTDPGIPGDFDGDGNVGFTDLNTLLAAWGSCPAIGACDTDLDGDGNTGFNDLNILLANWG